MRPEALLAHRFGSTERNEGEFMSKIRVYELARELNLTNKVLMDKLQTMGVTVGSHMSSLDDEVVTRAKAVIFGKKARAVEDTRVKPTVIRRRRKAAEPEAETAAEAEAEQAGEAPGAGVVAKPEETLPATALPKPMKVKRRWWRPRRRQRLDTRR